MVLLASRKPMMALYSGTTCIYSHSCRIVLFEKEVECHLEFVDPEATPDALAELNPYNETPTLVDRDLVLYGAHIINEYLDERLPHPPLMPVDPVSRGRARLMVMRLKRDWFDILGEIEDGDARRAGHGRQVLRDGLIAISPVFSEQEFMLGEEYTLVDTYLAPLLWRLPYLGIDLPRQAKALSEYADRLFARPAFTASLTEAERQFR